MTKDEIQMIAFNVISNSGDAYDCFMKASEAASEYRFDDAEELIKQGDQALVKAHQAQTDLLHAEINGEDLSFSIILIHSQDHLMHSMSYEQNVKDLIKVYKAIQSLQNK